ncbi:rna-binding protein [Nannochloropsis gaditana]|uniref:Rna-binding protein n=1 Tax=Nannochloropsis gaditana TaxID=72520 RepID=W7TK89_9STRA|nr:rna-binding protein [Nannochloropsis gaditana]
MVNSSRIINGALFLAFVVALTQGYHFPPTTRSLQRRCMRSVSRYHAAGNPRARHSLLPMPSSISDFLDDTADVDKEPRPSPAAAVGVGDAAPKSDPNVQYFVRCGRCNAAYAVGADLVRPEGGRVKCEVCGHTWFQASNRLQVLSPGYVLKDYPEDLKEKVAENVRNNRHPLDTSAAKGAISVFVGNLPFSMAEADVQEMFSEHGGVVSVTIVKDQLNRSKGFGFVEMADKEEGERAIAALDGREMDGRPINVRLGTSKAQPRMRKERTQMKRAGGGGSGGSEE